MPLYSTTQPLSEDGKRVLLGRIAQAVSDGFAALLSAISGAVVSLTTALYDAPAIVKIKTVSVAPGAPVLILEANPKRRRAVLRNLSGIAVVFLGDNTVSAAGPVNGFPLYTGTPINQPAPYSIFELNTVGELWGASSGSAVSVIEFLAP